jgi:hypothetical protein
VGEDRIHRANSFRRRSQRPDVRPPERRDRFRVCGGQEEYDPRPPDDSGSLREAPEGADREEVGRSVGARHAVPARDSACTVAVRSVSHCRTDIPVCPQCRSRPVPDATVRTPQGKVRRFLTQTVAQAFRPEAFPPYKTQYVDGARQRVPLGTSTLACPSVAVTSEPYFFSGGYGGGISA